MRRHKMKKHKEITTFQQAYTQLIKLGFDINMSNVFFVIIDYLTYQNEITYYYAPKKNQFYYISDEKGKRMYYGMSIGKGMTLSIDNWDDRYTQRQYINLNLSEL